MPTVYADPKRLYARMLRRCIRTESGCWYYTGSTFRRGYSRVAAGKKGKRLMGHQLTILAHDIEVPDGFNIDHICHDSETCRLGNDCPHRRCVNPAHLKVVTQGENKARLWESGLCRQGHELKPTKRRRYCPKCVGLRRRRQRLAAATT